MSRNFLALLSACAVPLLCGAPGSSTRAEVAKLGASRPAPIIQDMSLVQQGVNPAPSSLGCGFDRITISPSGIYAAFWRRQADIRLGSRGTETGDAVVVNLDCLRRHRSFRACQAVHIESLGSIHYPMFAESSHELSVKDSRLGLITHKIRYYSDGLQILSSKRENIAAKQANPLQFYGERPVFNGGYISHIERAFSSLKAHSDKTLRMIQLSLDRDGLQGLLAESSVELKLTVFDSGGQSWSSDVPSAFLAHASVGRSVDGRVMLTADGVAMTQGKDGKLKEVPNAEGVLRRPLIEAVTGRIVGFFGEKKIERFDGENIVPWKELSFVERSLQTDEYIIDASTSIAPSGNAKHLAAITGDVWGRRKLHVSSAGGVGRSFSLSCGQVENLPEINDEIVDIGDVDWPVVAKLYRGPGQRRGLVVFIHGGPGASAGFGNYLPTTQFYLREGYDVLIPEVSGSVGRGVPLSSRLKALGADAVQRDADYISAYSKMMRRKYTVIVAHAESFGAVTWLWTHRQPSTFDKSILLVPLLNLREPEDWTKYHQLGGYSPKFQRAFESTFFGEDGSRRKFAGAILGRASDDTESSNTLIIQAKNDPTSRPEDTAKITSNGAKLVTTNTFHAGITADPETWKSIRKFLDLKE